MAGRSMTVTEFEEDHLFMQIADELQEMGQENIHAALGGTTGEQWEEISFNVLEYSDRMQ